MDLDVLRARAIDRFAEWARVRPDECAVRLAGREYSYRHLDRAATAVAARLIRQGAGPDRVVGVVAHRTPEAVAAMLAVLRVGAAYLPVAAEASPSDRAGLLRDAGATVTLTEQDVTPALAAAASGEGDEEVRQFDAPHPESTAYVIRTSGSTGTAKLVAVPYRSIDNLAAMQPAALGVGRPMRILTQTSLTFDVWISDVLLAVCTGSALHISEDRDPDHIVDVVRRHGIELMQAVPALLAGLPPAPLPTLTTVVSGGDLVSQAVLRRFAGPGRRYVNVYGTTEAGVFVTTAPLTPDGDGTFVGHPVPGCRIEILDEGLHRVPDGEVGEICIAGPVLARGYLGRPGATADSFVPDPWAEVPGARMYRSGDLGRRREDGGIEFRGRRDSVVKVRGMRVHLTEIESILGTHPAVRECAVALHEMGVDDHRLVAYVRTAGDVPPSRAELRAALRNRLPEHAVPAHVVQLRELPTTANGKVDRAALPRPDGGTGTRRDDEPRTPTEQTVAEVWCEVLQVPSVSRFDDFFDLGGHSVLVTRTVSRLRSRLGKSLPVDLIFRKRILHKLASALDERTGAEKSLPPISRTRTGASDA